MSTRMPVTALAAVGIVSLALGANAALSKHDTKFVQEAAEGGLAEVELGKLAQEKAIHAEVQDFAKSMVDDHGSANAQLKILAQQNGIDLPAALNRKHQRLLDRLQKLTGGDFDREYMEHMVRDHKHDVKAFRKEAKAKEDSPVRVFAQNTLPTLEGHLMAAEKTSDIAEAGKR